MKPIKATDHFSAFQWALIEQHLACNIPAKLNITDRAMADLLERAGADSEAIKKKHGCAPDDPSTIRFLYSRDRRI